MKKIEPNRFIITVKVGPKGQITIPAEGRKLFDINVGDTLFVLGDKARGGMALMKSDAVYSMMEGIYDSDKNK